MKDTTRRGFMITAGAGAAAVGAATLTPAIASAAPTATPSTRTAGHVAGPLVAHIADASSGTVSVMVGEREVVVHDHELVARLVQASR